MVIGLISDTHSYLDPQIASYFDSCHEIWHAGDIGNAALLNDLRSLKPTYAVFGNIDPPEVRHQCPEDLWLEREGLNILITHIAGTPGRYSARIKSLLKEKAPDLLICGHSHFLKVTRDTKFGNMWFINPGAAGRQGFHREKTIMRITLEQARVSNMEVIKLGKRGALPQ